MKKIVMQYLTMILCMVNILVILKCQNCLFTKNTDSSKCDWVL